MRVFIASFLPKEIEEKVSNVQKILKTLSMKLKLVEKENLHLSYTFLGEKTEKEVKNISERLSSILKNYSSFEVKLKGIDFIPSKNFFRVISVKVESEIGEKIREEIYKKIGGSSHPLHLTLARVKRVGNKQEVIEKLEKVKIDESFLIDEICIVKSILTPSGPIYSKLYRFSLKRL